MIKQRIDDKIDIKQDSNSGYDIQVEEKGAEVALSFTIHTHLYHKQHEEDAVGYPDCKILILATDDGFEVVKEESYDG